LNKLETSQYEIKEVPRSDFNQIIDLWSLAFNIEDADPIVGTRAARDRITQLCQSGMDYIVGAYDGDYIAAVAAVIEFPTHLGDKWIQCGGIAGVATQPQYRRQKLVNKLLTDCMQQLHERKVPLSALWPFDYDFYGAMGWALTDVRYKIDTLTAKLNKVPGNARNYKAVELGEHHEAKALHKKWIQKFNLSMERSAFRWTQLLFPPGSRRRLFIHKDGYMIWNLSASFDKILQITEWCYLTDDAFRDGLALLAQMDSQYDHVIWLAPEIDSLYRIAGPSKAHTITQPPGMMSRVVHLGAFMDAIGSNIDIKIRDPLGVTGPKDTIQTAVTPGALLQHTTGFWQQPQDGWPPELYKIANQYPSFTAEQF
jgi:predicted acetyltransferase